MAEYIDRDALKKQMASFVPFVIDASNQAYADGLTDAYSLICQAPAADVVERKTGKWLFTQDDEHEYCTCSKCGYETGENWMIGSEIPYCQMCGSYNGGDDDV